MKQEEKDLLLKDLCARLPYGVKVQANDHLYGKIIMIPNDVFDCRNNTAFNCWNTNGSYEQNYGTEDVKPYLRPMSSMTEDECAEWHDARHGKWGDDIDFLNSHLFDWRGLIEKGLALIAPDGMYETE